MDILRTIIVSAYQAARQRGEGEHVAFDRAFAIYRERNPDRPLDEARAEVSRMIFEQSGTREARGGVTVLDNRNDRGERPVAGPSPEIQALRRRLDDVERAQAALASERIVPLESKLQQAGARLDSLERRQDKVEDVLAQIGRHGQDTSAHLNDISAQIAALAARFPQPPPGEPKRESAEEPRERDQESEPGWTRRGDEPPWLRNPLLFAWPWVWWFRLFRW